MAIDLRELYGFDTLEPGFFNRPWWNLRAFIYGLLDKPTRLAALTQ